GGVSFVNSSLGGRLLDGPGRVFQEVAGLFAVLFRDGLPNLFDGCLQEGFDLQIAGATLDILPFALHLTFMAPLGHRSFFLAGFCHGCSFLNRVYTLVKPDFLARFNKHRQCFSRGWISFKSLYLPFSRWRVTESPLKILH